MKRILTIGLSTLIMFSVAFAQKRSTILGDAFTGAVLATDDKTREITIKFEEQGKTETFTSSPKKNWCTRCRRPFGRG
jgi:hypothetical protein